MSTSRWARSLSRWRSTRVVAFFAFTLVLGAMLASASGAHADSNGVFTYTDDGASITITGCASGCSGSITVPSSINSKPVTAIGPQAFRPPQGSSVSSISIPQSVTSLDDNAFMNTYGLTQVTVDSANASFMSSSDVLFNKDQTTILKYPESRSGSTYALPDTVTQIGEGAFAAATNLQSVTLGSHLETIDTNAFFSATNLTTADLPESVVNIGNSAFRSTALQDVTFGSHVTQIGGGAYAGTKLTDVTIPGHVTSIGYQAFLGIVTLSRLTFGDGDQAIDDQAFFGASPPGNVLFGTGVKTFGSYVFNQPLAHVQFKGSAPVLDPHSFANTGTEPFYYRTGSPGTWPSAINGHSVVGVSGPTIVSQPTPQSAATGSGATFTVLADSLDGTNQITYQWKKDGIPVAGAATNFNIYAAAFSDTGTYSVDVTNWAGTTTSDAVSLAVYHDDVAGLFNYTETASSVQINSCAATCSGTVTIPSQIVSKPVTAIASGAFYQPGYPNFADSMTGIALPSTLTAIGELAFGRATLGSVTIPASVATIGDYAFTGASITDFTVEQGNAHFASSNGVLFNHDLTHIVNYPIANSSSHYDVPNSVVAINTAAFNGATQLRDVVFGNGLLSIGESAFYGTALTSARFLGSAPSVNSSIDRPSFASSGSATFYYRSPTGGPWPAAFGAHTLMPVTAPTIDTQPTPVTHVSQGAPVALSVSVTLPTGSGTVSYQWKKDGTPLTGKTSPSLNIAAATPADAASYVLEATTWAGTTTSHPAAVFVDAPLQPNPPATNPPAPSSPPTNGAKSDQSVNLSSLPAKLKRAKTYPLPHTTMQGRTILWKLIGKKYCTVSSTSKIRCSKPTGKSTFTLQATAAGTPILNSLSTVFTRKVS